MLRRSEYLTCIAYPHNAGALHHDDAVENLTGDANVVIDK